MKSIRPFTPMMWDSFNGAEKWPNGDEPSYGEHSFGHEEDVLVVVDPNGIEVHFMKARDEVSLGFRHEFTKELGEFMAESIIGHLKTLAYQEEGVAFVTRLGFFGY